MLHSFFKAMPRRLHRLWYGPAFAHSHNASQVDAHSIRVHLRIPFYRLCRPCCSPGQCGTVPRRMPANCVRVRGNIRSLPPAWFWVHHLLSRPDWMASTTHTAHRMDGLCDQLSGRVPKEVASIIDAINSSNWLLLRISMVRRIHDLAIFSQLRIRRIETK